MSVVSVRPYDSYQIIVTEFRLDFEVLSSKGVNKFYLVDNCPA